MSDKPTLDYERPKLVPPSGLRAWHYVAAAVAGVAGAACGGFLMWLLDASLADNEFALRVGGRGIGGGAVLVGLVAFNPTTL